MNGKRVFSPAEDGRSLGLGDMAHPPFYRGIYPSWCADVPNAFATEGWRDHCRVEAAQLRASLQAGRPATLRTFARQIIYGGDVPRHLASPLNVARSLIVKQGRASVVDIGGGYGDNFHHLSHALGDRRQNLAYEVVDNGAVTSLGREVYAGKPFAPEFADRPTKATYDLALLIGTLHYVEDWRSLLKDLGAGSVGYVHLSRSPLRRDGETFLTRQTLSPPLGSSEGRKIGEANVWVISRAEILGLMAELGYEVCFNRLNCRYRRQMSALPESHRDVSYWDITWRR